MVLSLDQPARSERRDLVLVFTSEFGEVRRTPESVPADWATRPPAELAALLAHATRVGSVRPRR